LPRTPDLPAAASLAGAAERMLGGRSIGFYLNFHDIMFVAARKRGR
jgi:hypothetical protein